MDLELDRGAYSKGGGMGSKGGSIQSEDDVSSSLNRANY